MGYNKNMSICQFIDYLWEKEKLFFILRTLESNEVSAFEISESLSIEVTDDKRCIGYIRESDEQLQACANQENLLNIRSGQCERCKNLENRQLCIMCKGGQCRNSDRKKYCDEKHVLYLTIFGENLVKVGIAYKKRREQRIDKQGGAMALFVAEADGQSIRQLESMIKDTGIPDRVTVRQKMHYVCQKYDEKNMLTTVEETYNNVINNVNQLRSCSEINPPEIYISNSYINNLGINRSCSKVESINPGTVIMGKLLVARGSLLGVEINNELKCFNMNGLKGWVINMNYHGEPPKGQISLF